MGSKNRVFADVINGSLIEQRVGCIYTTNSRSVHVSPATATMMREREGEGDGRTDDLFISSCAAVTAATSKHTVGSELFSSKIGPRWINFSDYSVCGHNFVYKVTRCKVKSPS